MFFNKWPAVIALCIILTFRAPPRSINSVEKWLTVTSVIILSTAGIAVGDTMCPLRASGLYHADTVIQDLHCLVWLNPSDRLPSVIHLPSWTSLLVFAVNLNNSFHEKNQFESILNSKTKYNTYIHTIRKQFNAELSKTSTGPCNRRDGR